MKSYYIAELDCFIRYLIIDGIEPVRVFLPGLATSAMSLYSTATHSKIIGNKSILIDYIGSGISDIPKSFNYLLERQADFVIYVLDHEGFSQCQFIGHSMGGTVATFVAFRRPDLVSQLILAESNIEAGGGVGSNAIASNQENDFINTQFPNELNSLREKAIQGDEESTFNYTISLQTDAICVYKTAVSIVNLPDYFKSKFLSLEIPRTFIYGEHNLPTLTGIATPDVPDMHELKMNGVNIGIVPDSGHIMFNDNLEGYVHVIAESLNRS